MLIVGLSGGFDPAWRLEYDLSYDFMHDAAAVLVDEGRLVAGIEQERLNRIKHTNRSAASAVRACLEAYGVSPSDVDCFAFYASEQACNQILYAYHTRQGVGRARVDVRTSLCRLLEQELGCAIDPARLHFADHHMCHALGAYLHGGFDPCLVVTLDGAGEGNSGLVLHARGGVLEELRSFPESDSLGYLYREVIRFLGYDMFEEYKVMGLAPYGNPARFRDFFRTLYELQPDGRFQLFLARVPSLHQILAPRQADEAFGPIHQDIAAALQEALETIVFHLLRHFRTAAGEARLCLSGGVAHNSSLNGKILCSGLFDEVFVHPAAHDAGCALGAALHADRSLRPGAVPPTLDHLFVGPDLGDADAIARTLETWAPLIRFERLADPCGTAARLMAGGAVIGWVQGRSEFGPRALGNRSILADPRPAENTTRIDKMIKKREAYRPFAPAVQEEHVRTFFDLPEGATRLPFMTFVVPVRAEQRALLGAVTHVDGSARVQTVSRADNERFWQLIGAFGELTGVPVLLNTSFNNNAEPIVDTLSEAITCYLTTGLDYLVAGDYLVTRAPAGARDPLSAETRDAYQQMAVSLPVVVGLRQVEEAVSPDRRETFNEIWVRTDKGKRRRISDTVWQVLRQAAAAIPLATVLDRCALPPAERASIVDELLELWAQRLVSFAPVGSLKSEVSSLPGATTVARPPSVNEADFRLQT